MNITEILQGFLNNTLIVKYDGCVAEKSSTKRITIALSCASMTGEKVAPQLFCTIKTSLTLKILEKSRRHLYK
jgi:hypothetical protein